MTLGSTVVGGNDQAAFAQLERQIHGLGQPGARLTDRQTVDHHLDVVPHLPIELQVVGEMDDLAVHSGPHEALLDQVDEQIAVPALLRTNHRGQNRKLRAGGQTIDPLDDLLARLSGDRPPALRAMSHPGPGIKQPQIIVDFRDRADRRPRVLTGRFLRNRDRRAQTADMVDVRFGHLPDELPGKAGKAFDVPPLAFGVEGVERQRAFAGTTYAGQADQLVPR